MRIDHFPSVVEIDPRDFEHCPQSKYQLCLVWKQKFNHCIFEFKTPLEVLDLIEKLRQLASVDLYGNHPWRKDKDSHQPDCKCDKELE